jgi:uncharacterized protein (TIGR00725 family)
MASKRLLVAVIGRGNVARESPVGRLAFDVGKALVDEGYRVATGGLGGVMEQACRGARASGKYREGDVVGILPGLDPGEANPYVDIPLATGLGDARNLILANCDGVVAVGGGAGTLMEIAAAWKRRPVIVCVETEGWSGELAGRQLDSRRSGPLPSVSDATGAVALLRQALGPGRSPE